MNPPTQARPHAPALGLPVGHPEQPGEHDEGDRDLPRLPQVLGDQVLAEESDDRGGDRRNNDEPRYPLLGRLHPARSQRAQPRPQQADQVAPEVRHNRDERAQVERDVEGLVEGVVLL